MFTETQLTSLVRLGVIAQRSLYQNDKRVVNALQEALDILNANISREPARRSVDMHEFERAVGLTCEEVCDECVIACYNTAQYERGLEVCEIADTHSLLSTDDVLLERAQLHGHLGNFKEAERLLAERLDQHPADIWSYIHWGDLYYNWQVLPENQDLRRAEEWYYKAFDKGLHDSAEDGDGLIERLGDICIERLRRKADKSLLQMLEEYHVGRWMTLEALKKTIYLRGPDSVVFQHVQMALLHKINNEEKANAVLEILTRAYNLMPQEYLHGLCPFQMKEYYSGGVHSARILAEKTQSYVQAVEQGTVPPLPGAEGGEGFAQFQIEFMKGIDSVTGKQREKVVNAEYKKTQKLVDSGEFLWLGFTKYRHADDDARMNDIPGDPFML